VALLPTLPLYGTSILSFVNLGPFGFRGPGKLFEFFAESAVHKQESSNRKSGREAVREQPAMILYKNTVLGDGRQEKENSRYIVYPPSDKQPVWLFDRYVAG
jgi:hypothetical protein